MYLIVLLFFLSTCQKFVDDARPSKPLNKCDMKVLTSMPCGFSRRAKPRRRPCIEPEEIVPPSFTQPISLTIHENMPIKDVLMASAQNLGLSLNIDPAVKPRIVYSATDRPFISIIRDICELGGMRYKITGSCMTIECDTPYLHNYVLPFLKFSRESENTITSVTDIFRKNMAEKTTQSNGSDSSVSVKSNIDFWQELENTLKLILQGDNKFTLHRHGGIITVRGTSKEQKNVRTYLRTLEKSISSQVLIEAKIIEVDLRQEFRTGIDWSFLVRDDQDLFHLSSPDFKTKLQLDKSSDEAKKIEQLQSIIKPDGFFKMASSNFNAILNILEKFGALRVVSSPRITVLNNQTAVIKVARNNIFFTLKYHQDYMPYLEGRNGTNPPAIKAYATSEISANPVGFIMPIQASIKPDTNEIILFVRPTISRTADSVEDPAVKFNSDKDKEVTSKIPIVEVREIDSVLRLKEGQIAVLGGLMQVESKDNTNRIPGTGRLKPLDEAFGKKNVEDHVTELVILLKAEIRDDDEDMYDEADKRLMNCYGKDARPF